MHWRKTRLRTRSARHSEPWIGFRRRGLTRNLILSHPGAPNALPDAQAEASRSLGPAAAPSLAGCIQPSASGSGRESPDRSRHLWPQPSAARGLRADASGRLHGGAYRQAPGALRGNGDESSTPSPEGAAPRTTRPESSPAEALRMVASIDLELNHLYKPDPLSVWRRVVFDEALEERTHRLTFSLGSALATCSRTPTTLAGSSAVCFGLFFLMQHLIEQRASYQPPTGPDRIELVREPRPEETSPLSRPRPVQAEPPLPPLQPSERYSGNTWTGTEIPIEKAGGGGLQSVDTEPVVLVRPPAVPTKGGGARAGPCLSSRLIEPGAH